MKETNRMPYDQCESNLFGFVARVQTVIICQKQVARNFVHVLSFTLDFIKYGEFAQIDRCCCVKKHSKMAGSVGKQQILAIYKQLLRESQKFESYNFR